MVDIICKEVFSIKEKVCGIIAYQITNIQTFEWGGGGGTHQSFIQSGSTTRANPLPFYIHQGCALRKIERSPVL